MIDRRWLADSFAYTEGETEDGVLRRLERQRDVYTNLALGYEAAAESDRLPPEEQHKRMAIAATNFRRAAAHALLLGDYGQSPDRYGYENHENDELSARALFGRAAEAYNRLRMPYALLMETFASRRPSARWRTLSHWLDEEPAEGAGPYQPQLIYVLLAAASIFPPHGYGLGMGSYDEVYRQLESFRARPLGTLGFPLAYYLDLYAAFRGHNRAPTLEEAAFPFIAGYNTAVRQATSNDYHWRRLAIPFHPAEPDVFAVLLLTGRVMQENEDRSVLSLLERLPLAATSKTVLEGVLSDYDENQATGSGMAAFAD